jgi:general secretion pathway protein I
MKVCLARSKSVKRHRQAGFSLLELLVAFSIMALSLGLLYRVAGGSARNVSDVTQSQQAAWLAESILSSRSSVLEDGWSEDGESAGFQWRVRSNVFDSGINIPQAVPLHSVQVAVSWSGGSRPGKLEVVTLVPQRKPQAGDLPK